MRGHKEFARTDDFKSVPPLKSDDEEWELIKLIIDKLFPFVDHLVGLSEEQWELGSLKAAVLFKSFTPRKGTASPKDQYAPGMKTKSLPDLFSIDDTNTSNRVKRKQHMQDTSQKRLMAEQEVSNETSIPVDANHERRRKQGTLQKLDRLLSLFDIVSENSPQKLVLASTIIEKNEARYGAKLINYDVRRKYDEGAQRDDSTLFMTTRKKHFSFSISDQDRNDIHSLFNKGFDYDCAEVDLHLLEEFSATFQVDPIKIKSCSSVPLFVFKAISLRPQAEADEAIRLAVKKRRSDHLENIVLVLFYFDRPPGFYKHPGVRRTFNILYKEKRCTCLLS